MEHRIKIAVDAGHGSNTAGKRTPPMPENISFNNNGTIDVKQGETLREHIANVGVCVYLEEELIRNGYEVVKSGWNDSNAYDDEDISITRRQSSIRDAQCDYSVSVHFNAYGDATSFNQAEGIETFIHTDKSRINDSKALASKVQGYLIGGTIQKNRGVKTGPFGMVNCTAMGTRASILVELAFMTNEKEATTMMGKVQFWKECAAEICQGFCAYDGKTYVKNEEKQEEKEEESPEERVLYTVQVGAYLFANNAYKQLAAMIALGYIDAYVYIEKKSILKYYRVQIGAYSIRNNAELLVKKLKSQGISAYIKIKS